MKTLARINKFLQSPKKIRGNVYLNLEFLIIPVFGVPYGLYLLIGGAGTLASGIATIPGAVELGAGIVFTLLAALSITIGPTKLLRWVFVISAIISHVAGLVIGFLPYFSLLLMLILAILIFILLESWGYIFLYILVIIYTVTINIGLDYYAFFLGSNNQLLWYTIVYGLYALAYLLFHLRIDNEVAQSLNKSKLLADILEKKKFETEKKDEISKQLAEKKKELEELNQKLVKEEIERRSR